MPVGRLCANEYGSATLFTASPGSPLCAFEKGGVLAPSRSCSKPSRQRRRAALSFAYRHWDLKNPFAKNEPPLQNEPQISYLMLADIRRLLAYLRSQQESYGSQLAFHLAKGVPPIGC